MNIWNIIKNPVMIGLIAGIITYTYMKWRNDKDNAKNKDKNKKKKDINLLIPLSVFIVFWFISYAYFSSSDADVAVTSNGSESIKELKSDLAKELAMEPPVSYKFSKETETSEPKSFFMVSNGVQIPTKLPDTLFEIH